MHKETAKHTLKCLIACNFGEVAGLATGFLLGLDVASTLALAVGLAFTTGIVFTKIPKLRKMPQQVAKVELVGDIASIATMASVENMMAFLIPGLAVAFLFDAIFWVGLGIILPVAFLASYPIMYWTMKREMQKSN